MKKVIAAILLSTAATSVAVADEFSTGPVFRDHGENIRVENGLKNPLSQHFKILFDIYQSSDAGGINSKFDSVARFINMHVRSGVPAENIEVAMVVHGKASFDLLSKAAYQSKFARNNDSADLLNQLLAAKVQVYLCGQSAAHLGIENRDLIPGVSMSLSAMTANALLQQQGYTLNPF
ncbi:MAG: DsrE family protein [Gammaproteobacteria bacterium]|nr:DsrE family protein [Gammaproteobacteria bacterium]